jgi:catechol 2,3-dioxygenase-like lactoylglutathione lyase family enzyme
MPERKGRIMNSTVDRLLTEYDQGRITRRELAVSLSALLVRSPEARAKEPRIAVATLNHVTLNVSDVDRAVAFYQNLFGIPVVSRQENGVNLGTGSSFLGLYRIEGPPAIHHFCLGVEGFDADGVLKTLQAHGITGSIRMRGDVKELYFRDRDGIQVQLQDVGYRG